MASEIRVDKINSLSGVGTVTLSPTGVDIAGITTAATLRATTGIVTSLTAGSLTSLGAVSGTTGTFSGAVSGTTGTFSAAVSGTTGTFSGAVSGTTGTFTGDVDIADKIIHTGDTNTAIRFPAADTVTVETGGSERARVDSSGRLLLGTNSSLQTYGANPSLQVAGTSFDTSTLLIRRDENNANPPAVVFGKSRGSAGGNTVIQDDDQVGSLIFSAADGTDLTSVAAEIKVQIDGTPGSNDVPGRVTFNTTADGAASPTERLRIDSSGRVMIGSGTYIGGAALAVLGTSSTPNTYGSFAIGKVGANPTSGTTLANIRLNGGAVGTRRGAEINAIADANWTDGSSHPTYLTFGTVTSGATSATERMRIHAGGNVDIKTGNLVIGTAGKGIDFSNASPSASNPSHNILDDYEEGTWTLQVAHDAISSEYGRYTKIGRMVYATFEITFGSSSNSGHQYITGLPFTAAASSDNGGNAGGVARDYQNYDIENGPIYHISQNDTKIYFYKNNGQNMAASNTSGYNFRGTAVYSATT